VEKINRPYVLWRYEIINCPHPRKRKNIYSFSVDDIDFDVSNPMLVKRFLESIRVDGKPLPHKSELGLPYGYLLMDMSNKMKLYPPNSKNKRRPVCIYGMLGEQSQKLWESELRGER